MRLYIIALITFIILAHIAMWSSDMPRDLALRLTIINATGWTVILGGAWLVSRWAAAHGRRDRGE
ncbi:phenylalanyl-tRNA synthetase subunit beta [Yoonia sp.]|uniref:phenylalanyl-tRNA synthetase subunit beta n=1 Tax=Yoonia sp. TaxID=2212373 RepID=UPI002FDAC21E